MWCANVETAGIQTSNPKCVIQHLAHAATVTNHFYD